jgi:hypothetical protein
MVFYSIVKDRFQVFNRPKYVQFYRFCQMTKIFLKCAFFLQSIVQYLQCQGIFFNIDAWTVEEEKNDYMSQ